MIVMQQHRIADTMPAYPAHPRHPDVTTHLILTRLHVRLQRVHLVYTFWVVSKQLGLVGLFTACQ